MLTQPPAGWEMRVDMEPSAAVKAPGRTLHLHGSDASWTLRNLEMPDLHAVMELCQEAFPLEYAESWFLEVCSGRLISFGLFCAGKLAGLLVAELKTVAGCDAEVSFCPFFHSKL